MESSEHNLANIAETVLYDVITLELYVSCTKSQIV